MPLTQSTMRLFLLTLFVCLVYSRPAERVKRRACGDGGVDLAGDCVPVELVKKLRRLLCGLASHLSNDNPLSGLDKFCLSNEKRLWGNDAFRRGSDDDVVDDTIFGNDGFKRFEDKRAWWHSGLKPDRR